MRRYSEKLQPATGAVIVKASLSGPQQTKVKVTLQIKRTYVTAYKRNMESLEQELKKLCPLTDLVKKLLKSFNKRRKVIDEYLLHTTELLEEFPFLKSQGMGK